MKKEHNRVLLIIILSILLIDFFSDSFEINKSVKNLLIDILFALGGLTILFSTELRIFVLMNIFGFIILNLGLSTNSLFQSGMLSEQLVFNLHMIKLVLSIFSLVLIILGFYERIYLRYWKEKIRIDRKKIIAYYLVGTIILQLAIKWI